MMSVMKEGGSPGTKEQCGKKKEPVVGGGTAKGGQTKPPRGCPMAAMA